MKKGLVLGLVSICFLLIFAGGVRADEAVDPYPIMRPDRVTRLQWIEAYERAPRAYIDASRDFSKEVGGSRNLLSHLNYIPAERDQGHCGNCWAWAGTGVMEIALHIQEGISDRLSVQFISSCNTEKSCCDGGWLYDLTNFYGLKKYAIPWSNTNATWQNGDGNCNVPCENIATSPKYEIKSIAMQTITTQGVGQTTAIANIKNVLNQNKAVWFGFFMSTKEDWNNFYSFWDNEPESAVWDFNPTCGKPYDEEDGGGHAVLCVGYNDDDPTNRYWIMLNSWSTASGGRPNGLFRVAMDMNYDCQDTELDPNLYFQTLDIGFQITPGRQTVYVDHTGACSGFGPCSSTIQGGINLADNGSTIKITGGTYPEDVNLNVGKNLTFKGGYNSTYSAQTMETVCRKFTIEKGTAVMDRVTVSNTPASEVASVVFYNNLTCSGISFTADFSIGGKSLTSLTGAYSACEELDCGKALSWSLYANAGSCGVLTEGGANTLTCGCLYGFVLTLDENDNPVIQVYPMCPGDCTDIKSFHETVNAGSMRLVDCMKVDKPASSVRFQTVKPLIAK